jgi:Protein of unknown function (DUF1592)/Protein of unknown function (DUF1588)/Protein of unknown function (DUF1595)/Protein of unknown function (DUF1585)/Protein of unknown function (DUF1587)
MIRHLRWFVPSLVGGLWLLSSCSGTPSDDPDLQGFGSPSGSVSNGGVGPTPGGTTSAGGLPVGSGAVSGMMPAGSAGASGTQSMPNPLGSSGIDDPYAIPATPPASQLVETARVARLSRLQWTNTVRDLLKLSDISAIDKDVSGDALFGFDSQADALFVGEMLRKELEVAAERLADKVIGDPAVLAQLVPAGGASDTTERARAFITSFGLRAFRRPLSDAEVTAHLELFSQGPTLYPGVDAFNAGVSLVLQAMLQSPHFLYRTELGTAVAGAANVPLDDYEVASKIAFALTNTMPDDELLAAAAAGELSDVASITAHAERILDGSKGNAGLNNFQTQVFRLGTYDTIQRDPDLFPDFTPETPRAMREEVVRFLDWIFMQGGGVKDFYTSPVGFANSALAPLYGLTGDFTSETFKQVELDATKRSGLLTQPGFLSAYIKDGQPDIIHRGVFIASRILCVTLPAPDPNATSLVEFQPDMTNRERVEETTGEGTCGAACHYTLLNPLGYAFENYDAIGKYRTTDKGKPVNAADRYMLDGEFKDFTNGVELSHLIADAKQTHNCYAKNMMNYLHGRVPTAEDQAEIDYYARLSRAGMLSLRDLALSLVTSDAFLNRLP